MRRQIVAAGSLPGSFIASTNAAGGALLLLLLGACGGHANEPGVGQTASGAPGSGLEVSGSGGLSAGGASSTANASAGNSGGFMTPAEAGTTGSAGAPPVLHPALACDSPTPRAQGGGYLLCTDGSLRRASAAACTSSLPRATADLPIALDECTSDTDCTGAPYGFCAYGGCKYGCVVDDDCAASQACFCGDAIGTCISASCRSDADCPADFPCTGYQEAGFATPDSLACQSPLDACLTDAQCNSLNPRVSCKVQLDHRVCYLSTIG